MLFTDNTSPILALIRSFRRTEDELPSDSGGDRSRASENQVSHTPRRFSNQLEPSS